MAATNAFAEDGLRRAFDALSLRGQVAGVMEEMLATVEHWKLANDVEAYRARLLQEQAEASRAREAAAVLEAQAAAQAAERAALRETAREVRDRLVEALIGVGKDLAAKEALAGRARQLARQAERVPRLERALRRAEEELKDAQRLLEERQQPASAGNGGGVSPTEPTAAATASPTGEPSSQEQGLGQAQARAEPKRPHTLHTTFMRLEEGTLLRVFAYLSVPDVLATAEVCRGFYDRVGAIFGGGSQQPSTEQPQQQPQQPQPPQPAAAATTSSSSSSFLGGGLSLLGGGGGGDGGFSLAALTASLLPPPSKASAAARSVLEAGPVAMTEKLAASVAGKLSGPELKSIIAMTEKSRKLEGLIGQFQAENEDVRARLQGADSVKELLLAKLRETEAALKRAVDGASGAARQRSSDQEVIAFLDGRTQELEAALRETAERLAHAREEHRRERAGTQEQLRVLQDVLAFERQQAEAKQAEFKAQKRILAKEVKSLRGEVLARQRERDALREELRALRAAGSLGGGVGGGGMGMGGGMLGMGFHRG